MTDTFGAADREKANGAFIARLHGMQLRSTQQRLLAALLRRPSLVPTVLRSGIQRDHFPKDWRNAFDIATKEPGRGKQIAADPNGDLTIRRLYTQIVELEHGPALRIAEQIVFNVRRAATPDDCGEDAAGLEREQDGIDIDLPTGDNGHGDSAEQGAASSEKQMETGRSETGPKDSGAGAGSSRFASAMAVAIAGMIPIGPSSTIVAANCLTSL